ncbi:hypothetical protein CBER1_08395 [Cercospora berteroae]|uniref:RING-type domain-containing protein n=1 Tax=Cercospora berteroae TaxID=357750 RepID=A0A2S6CG59_9PEZI|nr:hypothetical protein CBER1_08395 [Cercospora berteroae]
MPSQVEFLAALKATKKAVPVPVVLQVEESCQPTDLPPADGSRAATEGESQEEDDSSCCPICALPAATIVTTPCSHDFCPDCAEAWFLTSRTCPMCRQQLFSGDLAPAPWPPAWLPQDIVWLPVGESEIEDDAARARAALVGHEGERLQEILAAETPERMRLGMSRPTCEHMVPDVGNEEMAEFLQNLKLAVFMAVHWFKPRLPPLHENDVNAASQGGQSEAEHRRRHAGGACSTAWKSVMDSMMKTVGDFIDAETGELWHVHEYGEDALARLRKRLHENWRDAWAELHARSKPFVPSKKQRRAEAKGKKAKTVFEWPRYSNEYETVARITTTAPEDPQADQRQERVRGLVPGHNTTPGRRRVERQFAQDFHDVVEYVIGVTTEFFVYEKPDYATKCGCVSHSDHGDETDDESDVGL